jgi:hypothetical protein
MKIGSRKLAVEMLGKTADAVRSGRTEWSLIADLFVLFMDEHQKSETTKNFVNWLRYEAQDWLDEATSWDSFFGVSRKREILKFIKNWVNEKDIPNFMDFVKKEREDLWEFLTDPEIGENEYF